MDAQVGRDDDGGERGEEEEQPAAADVAMDVPDRPDHRPVDERGGELMETATTRGCRPRLSLPARCRCSRAEGASAR